MPSPAGKGDREAVDEENDLLPPSGREGDHEVVEGARGRKSKAACLIAGGYEIRPCEKKRNITPKANSMGCRRTVITPILLRLFAQDDLSGRPPFFI